MDGRERSHASTNQTKHPMKSSGGESCGSSAKACGWYKLLHPTSALFLAYWQPGIASPTRFSGWSIPQNSTLEGFLTAAEQSDFINEEIMPCTENWLILQKNVNSEISNTERTTASLTKLNTLYPNEKYEDELTKNTGSKDQ